MMRKLVSSSLVAAGLIATAAQAGTISMTLPEYNGAGSYPATETVGTFSFAVPVGETIVGAVISGQFGNSSVSSTAVQTVMADGIAVATCPDTSAFCWNTGPEAWSYTFAPSQFGIFADGSVVVTDYQPDCCIIRLGETTLTLTTAPVPEPETYAMMLAGLGILGAAARRRRSR